MPRGVSINQDNSEDSIHKQSLESNNSNFILQDEETKSAQKFGRILPSTYADNSNHLL